MLVLTRKANESIVIGDGILVTVTRIEGNRVRFGIEASDNVRVLRGELQQITPLVTNAVTTPPSTPKPTLL